MKNCPAFLIAAMLAAAFAVSQAEGPDRTPGRAAAEGPGDPEDVEDLETATPNRYIGAYKCKNCHASKAGGSVFEHWKNSKHATAFDTLAGNAAGQIAQAQGIANPQTSQACLRCHTTAFGQPAERLAQGFKPEGVQCEACHGPGMVHVKTRMANADNDDELEPGEIVESPGAKTCLRCHNKGSPTFKPFCQKDYSGRIRHLDPRKPRTEAQLRAMACPGDCGVEHPK